MKKRFFALMTGVTLTAVLLSGCTSNPEDSIFDPNSGMPTIFEPLEDDSYEEEFHPEDWIEYDEEGEPILPDGVEKSDVFDDDGNFIGDPSMFGFVSGSGNHSARTGGQNGGQDAGGSYAGENGDAGFYTENGDGSLGSEEGQLSEGDWSESSDDEGWEEDSDGGDSSDDGWVEDSDDSDDDEDDGVELWNGTGEWNGY